MGRTASLLCGFILFLVLSSCLPPGQSAQTPAPPKQAQEDSLVQSILKEAIGQGSTNRFIAQVRKEGVKGNAPIEPREAGVLQCWRYEKGQLAGCAATEFQESFEKDTTSIPWKFSYVIFSVTEVDTAYTKATVRMEVVSGPKAGSGTNLRMTRAGDQWRVESQERVWVS